MRSRRSATALGLVMVALYASAALWALATTDHSDRSAPPGGDRGGDPAAALVEAWQRARTGTFVATGTFERSSALTGATISSPDVVAQRPPDRLHRRLGALEGRFEDRVLSCAAPPPGGEAPECTLGPPGARSYAEWVADQVAGVEQVVSGPDPLYLVDVDGSGCFRLDQRRADPRAPFGVTARFCFDPATGALVQAEVRYEGGVRERVVVHDVGAEVSDADLDPARAGGP